MNCMKCGREISPGQVFCDDCLAEMKKYPVAPNTPVQLPSRKEQSAKKLTKRRSLSLDEQVKTLKSRLRLMTGLFIGAALLALALVYPAVQYLMEDHFEIGQNYSTVASTSEPAPAETAAN